MKIELTPLYLEIFKTQAYIKAYTATTLNKKQLKVFDEKFKTAFKESIKEFAQQFPEVIDRMDLVNRALEE